MRKTDRTPTLPYARLAFGLASLLSTFTYAGEAPEVVSVQKIWDHGKWNGTTDLIRFQDKWWCSFREANSHAGGEGLARILVSHDGTDWKLAATLSERRLDLRDPHLSIMPNGKLMCILAATRWGHDDKNSWDGRSQALTRSPRVSFSTDGFNWTTPKQVLAEDHWLWRVTWNKGIGYCMSKLGEGRDPRRLMLYTTTDGLEWNWVCEPRLPDNTWNGSETTLRFLPDDTLIALTRPHWVGSSQPPYREWKWTRFASYQEDSRFGDIGGPNFIRLPDGSLWGSGRLYAPRKRTVLARMTATSYEPVLDIPSGGDNSYPGMVWHDGRLWLSYYSGHEGKANIYLAKIRIPLKTP
ncbi:MAG: glycoside hydrolase [Planctomycetes bacterium]|nr:glycoside hydrolase [Planctomycetota bacterium]